MRIPFLITGKNGASVFGKKRLQFFMFNASDVNKHRKAIKQKSLNVKNFFFVTLNDIEIELKYPLSRVVSPLVLGWHRQMAMNLARDGEN